MDLTYISKTYPLIYLNLQLVMTTRVHAEPIIHDVSLIVNIRIPYLFAALSCEMSYVSVKSPVYAASTSL